MHMKTQTYEPLIWANFGGVLGYWRAMRWDPVCLRRTFDRYGVSLGWLLAETCNSGLG